VFNQRRFEPAAGVGNSHYDVKLGYPSSHQFALDAVPSGSRVLDIGAGPGRMASELVGKGCEVTVVDQFPAPDAPTDVEVLQQDLDDPPVFDARKYDHLLMLDVIEHLKDPEQFLEQLVDQFDFGPRTLVLTTPNVAFVAQRLMLLGGQFNYGNAGILDRTHTRLFTFRSLRRLLVDSGFRLREVRGVPAPWPKVLGDGALGRVAVRANELLIRASRTLFSYQIFVVADCVPGVRFVLDDSRSRSAPGLPG
jgi:2-polyprenyl-3-methyl-5-hydroxy-6-metoxy-1,4-benzoquinol methylase